LPELRSGPLIVGGVLVGTGFMLVLAGMAVGGAHVVAATRQWISEMEVPPSERARQQWTRAKAAARAGASSWQNGTEASVPASE
jgi:hypothetical protein